MKRMFKKYAHCLWLLYFPLYLAAFSFIENHGPQKIHIIETTLDQRIPFIEYFIIPYYMWFIYIAVGVTYFLLREKESYKNFMIMGMIGMTAFILISILIPNGLQLRPTYFARENIFVEMTRYLYSVDTPTNVFPSIHVFNSMAMHTAISRSPKLKKNRVIQWSSFVLCVSIILSTMFLKQHSVFDVISGMGLFLVTYSFVYGDLRERVFVRTASIYNEK